MKKLKYIIILSLILVCALFSLQDSVKTLKTDWANQSVNATYNSIKNQADDGTLTTKEAAVKLDRLIQNNRHLSLDMYLKLFKSLSTYHIINKDYAKAIESAVVTIDIASSIEKYYYEALMLLDLGDMFISLGDYDIATEIIHRALALDIADSIESNKVKEYAYINLALICRNQGRYSDIIDLVDKSRSFVSLTDPYYEEKLIIRELLNYSALLGLNQPEEALSGLLALYDPIFLYGNHGVPNLDVDYLCLLTYTYLSLGDFEEGFERLDTTLQVCDERGLHSYKLKLLRMSLIILDYYTDEFDAKRLTPYVTTLIKEYNTVLLTTNQNTVSHILKSYQNNQDLIANFEYKLKTIRIGTYIGLGILLLILLAFLRIHRIKKLSRLDGLTEILNRKAFDKDYRLYLRRPMPIALLMIDIDFFKKINDTYGHEVGDVVLRAIAKVITGKLPATAQVYRYGGEELCILYNTDHISHAVKLAETIRETISNMTWREKFTVTVSCGIAFSSETTQLFELADKRLYDSKNNGRNRVTYMSN